MLPLRFARQCAHASELMCVRRSMSVTPVVVVARTNWRLSIFGILLAIFVTDDRALLIRRLFVPQHYFSLIFSVHFVHSPAEQSVDQVDTQTARGRHTVGYPL